MPFVRRCAYWRCRRRFIAERRTGRYHRPECRLAAWKERHPTVDLIPGGKISLGAKRRAQLRAVLGAMNRPRGVVLDRLVARVVEIFEGA